MKLAVGADHAGYELKAHLVAVAEGLEHAVDDLGTHSGDSVDYPDFALAVARRVAEGEADLGLLVCGTGLGMAIMANKVDGVRAVTCSDCFSARMARAHNDANVLTVGGRVIGRGVAEEVLRAFLETPFEGGRHRQRLEKMPGVG